MLPCPFWPLAQHAGFGQNCSDGSIGSDGLVCIDTTCLEPSKCSSFPPISPVSGLYPYTVSSIIYTRICSLKQYLNIDNNQFGTEWGVFLNSGSRISKHVLLLWSCSCIKA